MFGPPWGRLRCRGCRGRRVRRRWSGARDCRRAPGPRPLQAWPTTPPRPIPFSPTHGDRLARIYVHSECMQPWITIRSSKQLPSEIGIKQSAGTIRWIWHCMPVHGGRNMYGERASTHPGRVRDPVRTAPEPLRPGAVPIGLGWRRVC